MEKAIEITTTTVNLYPLTAGQIGALIAGAFIIGCFITYHMLAGMVGRVKPIGGSSPIRHN